MRGGGGGGAAPPLGDKGLQALTFVSLPVTASSALETWSTGPESHLCAPLPEDKSPEATDLDLNLPVWDPEEGNRLHTFCFCVLILCKEGADKIRGLLLLLHSFRVWSERDTDTRWSRPPPPSVSKPGLCGRSHSWPCVLHLRALEFLLPRKISFLPMSSLLASRDLSASPSNSVPSLPLYPPQL